MRNILLIGGAGFIGSSLVKNLVEESAYSVYIYEPPFVNLSRLTPYMKKVSIINGMLCDIDNLISSIELYNIDTIVHLVSTLVPGSSYDDYIKEYQNVVFPTIRLLTYCADKNIKFVFFSSGGTIYGNSTDAKPFLETVPPAPISYYGLTKLNLENSILFEHRRKNLNYLIIRPSNPFGPGQNLYGNQGFIAVALGKILRGESIEIWGDGNTIRDYIYIDDLSKAVFDLIKSDVSNEKVNIGSGKGYTQNYIISVLKNVVGDPINVVYMDRRMVDVNAMVLDNSKIKELTGFHHTKIKEGITLFYNYIRQTSE